MYRGKFVQAKISTLLDLQQSQGTLGNRLRCMELQGEGESPSTFLEWGSGLGNSSFKIPSYHLTHFPKIPQNSIESSNPRDCYGVGGMWKWLYETFTLAPVLKLEMTGNINTGKCNILYLSLVQHIAGLFCIHEVEGNVCNRMLSGVVWNVLHIVVLASPWFFNECVCVCLNFSYSLPVYNVLLNTWTAVLFVLSLEEIQLNTVGLPSK